MSVNRRFGRVIRVPATALASGRTVYLRRPVMRDCETVISLMRRSRSLHLPWVESLPDVEAYRGYMKRIRGPLNEAFLLCRIADGEVMGVINLNVIVRGGFQSAHLGYWIGKEFAGEGTMTEALRLVIRYAFTHLKLHRLEANIQPGNDASIALVRRCGFRNEGFSPRYLKIRGRWRDHERWAILSDDI